MLGARTILDYLNEDCWRAVLRLVPVRDVMRTERASRRWQQVVLTYLQGLQIHVLREFDERQNNLSNACTLKLSNYKSFESWTHKLGSAVVAAYCINWKSFNIIRENCPNIETLQLMYLHNYAMEVFENNLNDSFQYLQGLHFYSCYVSDASVSWLVGDKALRELEFSDCQELTGQFLNAINCCNLKTLYFRGCRGLKTEMLSVVEWLSELTTLTILAISRQLAEEIQPVLDKMPKLEQLDIVGDMIPRHKSCEALCRLGGLKQLRVNFLMHDEAVEAVARCCKELRTLELLDCRRITTVGVEAIGRHGARLTSLKLHRVWLLEDEAVLAIIQGCPELRFMQLGGAFLSPALPLRAEAAWRATRPALRLELDLTATNLGNLYKELYEYEDEEVKQQYESIGESSLVFHSDELY